jgi:arylsulfatase
MTVRVLAALIPFVCLATSFDINISSADSRTDVTRPNILVVLADDLGYSDLGCYGGEIETPHIDALAAAGARFTQMYNSARCCPSRASLMTGLYPSQAGIGDFTTSHPHPTRGPGYLGRLNDSCVTMGEALGASGYECFYVGKWHLHPATGPISRGFDEFYGYTDDHSHDQYDADYYLRLPAGREKEIDPPPEDFYATDVFNQYALEFIRQGQRSGRPWFLFLGHSSPHFPVQAPAARADKYMPIYSRGWDVLREERFARMRHLGLVDGDRWQLSPRALVPVDRDDIANGYSGQPNPAWDSLDSDRQTDLARRMAIFAAMVESIDSGVGNIVEHLRETDCLDDTLIIFLSDNGACYEWGPYGFDGISRRGENVIRTGTRVREIGQPGTHQSYGSGWANLGNTPFRMYKHFTHEGGISTPLIAHWPKGFGTSSDWIRQPAHVMDVLPTVLEAAGAPYPSQIRGVKSTPLQGTSLLPAIRREDVGLRTLGFDHQGARAWREGDWKVVWSKRMPEEIGWELYSLAEDRCETNDLASVYPDRVASMAAEWEAWARRVDVIWEPPAEQDLPADQSPSIANRALRIEAKVRGQNPDGVVVAQGGNQVGYALHFISGRPAFDVRIDGVVTRIESQRAVAGEIVLVATLTATEMTLTVDGNQPLTIPSAGLIPREPIDRLSVGGDDQTAAGDYDAPNSFSGTVLSHRVETSPWSSEK